MKPLTLNRIKHFFFLNLIALFVGFSTPAYSGVSECTFFKVGEEINHRECTWCRKHGHLDGTEHRCPPNICDRHPNVTMTITGPKLVEFEHLTAKVGWNLEAYGLECRVYNFNGTKYRCEYDQNLNRDAIWEEDAWNLYDLIPNEFQRKSGRTEKNVSSIKCKGSTSSSAQTTIDESM